jgi:hypothetical protein
MTMQVYQQLFLAVCKDSRSSQLDVVQVSCMRCGCTGWLLSLSSCFVSDIGFNRVVAQPKARDHAKHLQEEFFRSSTCCSTSSFICMQECKPMLCNGAAAISFRPAHFQGFCDLHAPNL